MAEGILRSRWMELGRNDLHVASTGIHAQENQPAASLAVEVCQENGIDISHHLSSPLNGRDLKSSDIIFVMEAVQRDYITLFFPQVNDRTFLLAAWPDKPGRKSTVADPIGGTLKDYRRAFETIALHIDRLLPQLTDMF
ncbi:MAG: hypothetical protein GF398_13875 [Chitinivibrionales bacterium]|nr:hypothetical protein [Chitinivibrionales bacterium]